MNKGFEVGDAVEYRGRSASTIRPWLEGVVDGVFLEGLRIRSLGGRVVVHTVRLADVRRSRKRKEVSEMRIAPKGAAARGPARNEAYLAYVRAKPCAGCAAPGPSDPHHYGLRGVAQKASDYQTTPLCRRCHDSFHDTRELPGRNVAETRGDLLAAQVALLVRWIEVGA
jgi:hypothetical protein